MVKDRENYCRLIGLNPNKESTYTAESIESKISAKEKKWTSESKDKQNDLDRRFTINRNLEQIADIRRVMANPSLRAKEFDDARRLLRNKASRLNRSCVTLHDGTLVLIPGSAESLLKKIGWEGLTKQDLIKATGIKENSQLNVVDPKVNNAYSGLRDVNSHIPTDMLNELIGNRDLEINANMLKEGCSLTEIRRAFDMCEKRVSNVKQDILPMQDSYIQALRSVKTVIDNDESLELLIKYGKCMKALTPAMEAMDDDYGQPFTRNYIDEVLNTYMKGTNADMGMTISILENYCIKKKYVANFSNRESRLVICPNCGSMTEGGGNALCCSVCGFNIRTKCPNCGTEQSSVNKSCIKCGFNFQSSLIKAKQIEDRFNKNMESGLLNDAKNDLNELTRTYATYPNMDDLYQQLRSSTTRYESAVKNIETAYKIRKFKNCHAYCEVALSEFPDILDKNIQMKTMYEDCVHRMSDADRLCRKSEEAVDEDSCLSLLVSAADRCPDHPLTKSKMSEHPPESPADATTQVRDDKVVVKFAIPENRKNMTFCIYRAKGRLPTVTEDTIPLTEIRNSVYMDKTVDPGVDYYYAIYTKRYGILSREAAVCGPVTVFVEVDNVIIEPIGGGLRITYEKPKGCSSVRIWRKEGASAAGVGEEVEINHNGETTFDDYGLKGDVKYYYLFVAEYNSMGKTERSMGSAFSGTTVKFPNPVRDMKIHWNKSDGSFTAKWKSKENVVLYASPKKVTMYGRTVQLKDLNSWMTEIEPLETLDDGMRFILPDGAVQYLYPMIPSGNIAIRGKEVMVANLKPFRDVEKKMSGNDCDITMNWPKGADTAVIAIKNDSPATDPDDITAERITVSREAYDAHKMVRIPMGSSKKRIMTIFAQYEVDGSLLYSRGMSIDAFSGDYNKVSYTIDLEKSKKTETRVTVNFITDPSVSELPAMCAVYVAEGIPLKIWDGVSIWKCDRPVRLTNGRGTIVFAAEPNLDPRRVRVFFINEENYHHLRFIHPIYRED